ncbi:hypothetical protein RHMOL_Rhmol04G0168800 [Rhododendron molle]|uniref:Uncharacterized protein n=1 Tax=Rhododendron molle TaxID=49168 RepID=A0ACC0P3P9_RHOML|nr:hypothetical protein RHMOL_Rhmol04G0168800 [Rhododendron molle]
MRSLWSPLFHTFHLLAKGTQTIVKPPLTSKSSYSQVARGGHGRRGRVTTKGGVFLISSSVGNEIGEYLSLKLYIPLPHALPVTHSSENLDNVRGGRVKLHSITMPPFDLDHVEKGDALYAMELALSLKKLTNEKLLGLHGVADRNNDPQLADYIESEFLSKQVEAIKKISDYITMLRRVGKGHAMIEN